MTDNQYSNIIRLNLSFIYYNYYINDLIHLSEDM